MSRSRPPSRRRLPEVRDGRRQVDDEVELHVALRTEQLVAEGMDAGEAAAEARRRFAHSEETLRSLYDTARERTRRMRTMERMEGWWQDTRYAARGLGRAPLVTAFVVVALALGMGAFVTSFSLADRLLLRPPPGVQNPGTLTRVLAILPENGGLPTATAWMPNATYLALRDGVPAFAAAAAYRVVDAGVGEGATERRRRVGTDRDGFLALLGVRPLLGRLFGPDEDAAVDGPLAILNERVWREDFGADEDVVGRRIEVGGEAHTIVGVVPADFAGIEPMRVDVWTVSDSRRYRSVNYHIVGRLAPGADTTAVTAAAAVAHAGSRDDVQPWFQPAVLHAGSIRLNTSAEEPFEATMARWLTTIAVVILLVALGNVLNLVLARLARRQQELGVRMALGSGFARLVRMLALEGVLLAGGAGLLALLVVRVLEPMVRHSLMGDSASWTLSLMDGRLLLALLAVVAASAMAIGILPSLRLRGSGLGTALRNGRRTGRRGTGGVRTALTVLQAALSVVLLVGAGLFLRSMDQVRRLDLGVDRDRLSLVRAQLPPLPGNRPPFAARLAHEVEGYERMAERVRGLPGVQGAAVAIGIPLDGGSFGTGVHLPGRDSVPSLPGGGPYASAVSAEYFSTVGTGVLRGRAFTPEDVSGAEPVVIVNQTMAETLWPGGDALARCVSVGSAESACARVVGVVEDVHRVGLRDRAAFQIYLPILQQTMFGGSTLLVRSAATSRPTPSALREAVTEAVPGVRLVEAAPLSASLDDELRPLRLGIMAFGLSSVLALLVAVLGLYSVMAYTVAWRTRELGVRAALGASSGTIQRLVVGSSVAMAAGGVTLGLLLAWAGGRFVEAQLFQTSATDPVVMVGVAALLMAVAVVAGWIPGRRAARISPTEALRAE